MYQFDDMVAAAPIAGYAHRRQTPDSYVQTWMPPRGYVEQLHHFSIAPDYNLNGFHITSPDRRLRAYFDKRGRRLRRPARDGSRVSSTDIPDGWLENAQMMAVFLDRFRR